MPAGSPGASGFDGLPRQEPLTATSAPPAGGTPEHEKLCRARDQCREILKYVNEAVKQTENRLRLEGYQQRLDTTSLERASNPLAAEFKVGAGPGPGGTRGGWQGQSGTGWPDGTPHAPRQTAPVAGPDGGT